VSGRVSPVAGATIDFKLYGPGDSTCTGSTVFESLNVPYPVGGGSVTSAPYTPTQAGTYRWVASYSGDVNNAPVTGLCNDANETRTVAPATTTTTTTTTTPPAAAIAPITPPPPPPPPARDVAPVSERCTTPPGPAPAGGELCARGAAAIRGRTGCQGTAFTVAVTGRQIERVIFTLDGKIVRTLSRPNSGSRWILPVNPRKLRTGVHRVLARTIFRSQSGTRSRTLRVSFSRCSRRASSPAFTG